MEWEQGRAQERQGVRAVVRVEGGWVGGSNRFLRTFDTERADMDTNPATHIVQIHLYGPAHVEVEAHTWCHSATGR
jgi:hypothetical protein